MTRDFFHHTGSSSIRLMALVFSLGFAVVSSGCAVLGLGAAAGAAAGGCALLDENDDDMVTEAELSTGLFDAWDDDDDDLLDEDEFQAGVEQGDVYEPWSDDFGSWDADGDDALTEEEFSAGVTADESTSEWADSQCDDLGL